MEFPGFLRTSTPAPLGIALGGALLAALLLGGGTHQGLVSDILAQAMALPALALGLWFLGQRGVAPTWRPALALLAAIMILPLLQLVPLPPALWTRLPGRDAVVAGFEAAQLPLPWLGVSLVPDATWRAFLFLLVPAAVFVCALQMDARGRRLLSLGVLCFSLLAVLVGLAQLMAGPASPLYFYDITNTRSSVGFFANRNHHAALLYASMPFAAAWAIGCVQDQRPGRVVAVALCLLLGVALMLGLGMALSRAGLLLAMLAGLGLMAMAWRAGGGAGRSRAARLVLVMGLLGVVTVVQFGLFGILQRLERDPFEDYRFQIAATVAEAARAHAPVGAGMGSFVTVYAAHEAPETMLSAYVNRAHNDWLEVWLEAGVPGGLLMLAVLAWWLRARTRGWRGGWASRRAAGGGSALDVALTRAASLSMGLLLVHALLDYPLRTTALAALFALCAALLLPSRPGRAAPGFRQP